MFREPTAVPRCGREHGEAEGEDPGIAFPSAPSGHEGGSGDQEGGEGEAQEREELRPPGEASGDSRGHQEGE